MKSWGGGTSGGQYRIVLAAVILGSWPHAQISSGQCVGTLGLKWTVDIMQCRGRTPNLVHSRLPLPPLFKAVC